MRILFFCPVFFLSMACQPFDHSIPPAGLADSKITYKHVNDIPVLQGYRRMPYDAASFGAWLRSRPLKSDNKVYLYNGELKENQDAQFAVLDMQIGNKDLQQCADAIMRLRAEYLLCIGKPELIKFTATSGQLLSFAAWRKGTRYRLAANKLVAYQSNQLPAEIQKDFNEYLEFVFTYCGTLSLQNELKKTSSFTDMAPGYVLIKGGSPGHAMIVLDVAVNDRGEKIFMLAQSYMPAQDMHIVRNPLQDEISPWYTATAIQAIVTPEWTFSAQHLYEW